MANYVSKKPPTGAKFVFYYQSCLHCSIYNSYTDNYLKEVLTNYILLKDKYKILLIQHNGRPIILVVRNYHSNDRSVVTDFIQIITKGDTIMTKSEIKNYILNKQYTRIYDI